MIEVRGRGQSSCVEAICIKVIEVEQKECIIVGHSQDSCHFAPQLLNPISVGDKGINGNQGRHVACSAFGEIRIDWSDCRSHSPDRLKGTRVNSDRTCRSDTTSHSNIHRRHYLRFSMRTSTMY